MGKTNESRRKSVHHLSLPVILTVVCVKQLDGIFLIEKVADGCQVLALSHSLQHHLGMSGRSDTCGLLSGLIDCP